MTFLKEFYHFVISERIRKQIWLKRRRLAYKANYVKKALNNKSSYRICEVDDLTFVGVSEDFDGVFGSMIRDGRTFASNEMKLFHRLSNQYYGDNSKTEGYFLDIGSNIGTTSIYFRKKLDSNVKVIGFEPDSNNFMLNKCNIVLNKLEDSIRIENVGLGEKSDEMRLYKNTDNPGGNSVISFTSNDYEIINIISLDDYLKNNSINIQSIKYVWIDTEGFEPFVLFGGKSFFYNTTVPVFIEFNPQIYRNVEGLFDRTLDFLKNCWSGYINIQESLKGECIIHCIDELEKYKNSAYQVGDIFLIKEV
ncbi:MAG: FkbM family methyltransferase [Lachnospiraceae bacterium]|nr:FkbM family methyltransferase [Lachnospiraceae bacterium]